MFYNCKKKIGIGKKGALFPMFLKKVTHIVGILIRRDNI